VDGEHDHSSLGVSDSRTFAFYIWEDETEVLREASANAEHVDQSRDILGWFNLGWLSGLSGEPGYLRRVAAAERPEQLEQTIIVSVVEVPRKILAQQPFGVTCCVMNNTRHPRRIYLQVRRDLVGEIVPVGLSGVALGELEAFEKKEVMLAFLALSQGEHLISGIRAVDIDSRDSYASEPREVSVL